VRRPRAGDNKMKGGDESSAPETETVPSAQQSSVRVPEQASVQVTATATGDETADVPTSAELYRSHATTVARWAARLGGPTIDVEDIVHEVFIVVERRLSEFRGESKPSTWLYRITDLVTRAHRRKARFRRLLSREVEAEPNYGFPSSHLSPVEALIQRERTRLVYRAIDSLGERYRAVFVLFELEGLSGEQIATLTGLKVSTVWVRLLRARKRFVAKLTALREENRP
jgi:RNA polymerase sigma-70 factor, ECF subfamily